MRRDLFAKMPLRHLGCQLVGELECLDCGFSKLKLERGVGKRDVGAMVRDRFVQLGDRTIERRQVEFHDRMRVRQIRGQ